MSKRQELREKREKQERTQRILIIVGVVVIAIAAGLLLVLPGIQAAQKAAKPVGEIKIPESAPRPQAKFNSMGDPNAPVKIVEYSDFQCPYCAVFWKDTEAKIVEAYVKTGKVYFTYRVMGNWVSDNINQGAGTNKESQNAGLAAYCAGDQNKFWEYHDILFNNQNGENQGFFDRKYLDTFAEKIGLDMAAFKSCMDTEKYADMVAQGKVDGVKDITSAAGYDSSQGYGTPSFLVNGKLVGGAQPFSVFQTEIEAALAAQK